MFRIGPVVGDISRVMVSHDLIRLFWVSGMLAVLARPSKRIETEVSRCLYFSDKSIHRAVRDVRQRRFRGVRAAAVHIVMVEIRFHALARLGIGNADRGHAVPHGNTVRPRVSAKVGIKGAIFLENDNDVLDGKIFSGSYVGPWVRRAALSHAGRGRAQAHQNGQSHPKSMRTAATHFCHCITPCAKRCFVNGPMLAPSLGNVKPFAAKRTGCDCRALPRSFGHAPAKDGRAADILQSLTNPATDRANRPLGRWLPTP